jgi:transcriptional regulator with XRE-family HTH domain
MQPTANVWSIRLLEARKALNLTRAQLASVAGVSSQTVKAYELGLRRPSRGLLAALMDALKLDRGSRDEIFHSAGFAAIGAEIGPAIQPGYRYTEKECQAYLQTLSWPAFVVDDLMRVVCANRPAEALWGVDIEREVPDINRRTMLRFASDPRFASKITNWDDMVTAGIAIFKGHHLGAESLDAPSSFFAQVLEDLSQGDPQFVTRFFELFEKADPAKAKVRWGFPITWEDPEAGTLRFQALTTEANEPRGLAFNDWIPLDAETWERLGSVVERWK